ncbi:MAG: methyltransferase domain-containing protein [Opitutaceae bacterium]|nr:methyltransferase domain-containing protein [Opitutaceae bacterium]
MATALHWKIDECAVYFDRLHLRGWCHHGGSPIVRVEVELDGRAIVPLTSFGTASPDVAQSLGPTAEKARFEEWITADAALLGQPFALRMWLADGTCAIGEDALTNCAHGDPYFQSWENFLMRLGDFESGAVLEIGSRARSAITRRHRIPERLAYVGLDILPGPNVDIVGDAHELSRIFSGKKFVAVFSASVFEHLAMPWKVALELNRVLAPGGIVYTSTHQTWPPHEEPWDFWRFSQHSWATLFNRATGFEVLEAVVGEPARVHPRRTSPVTRSMPESTAWLGSAAIVRKTNDTALNWPVTVEDITPTMYPAGELAAPPAASRT